MLLNTKHSYRLITSSSRLALPHWGRATPASAPGSHGSGRGPDRVCCWTLRTPAGWSPQARDWPWPCLTGEQVHLHLLQMPRSEDQVEHAENPALLHAALLHTEYWAELGNWRWGASAGWTRDTNYCLSRVEDYLPRTPLILTRPRELKENCCLQTWKWGHHNYKNCEANYDNTYILLQNHPHLLHPLVPDPLLLLHKQSEHGEKHRALHNAVQLAQLVTGKFHLKITWL